MSLAQLLRRLAAPLARPLGREVDRRIDAAASRHRAASDQAASFELLLLQTARSVAASGRHQVPSPTEARRSIHDIRRARIGYFGNIANNAHNFVRSLRRLEYDAELAIQDGWVDSFVMNRPFWEDVQVECDLYDAALTEEHRWRPPSWIRHVAYDLDLQVRYQNRVSAIQEVQHWYRRDFGLQLPSDRALLLAQHMGSWPYLLAMSRYDVVQLSGSAIAMGAFCPVPYIVFPTGSDLYVSPFAEHLNGLLMRAGYRGASEILVCEATYGAYLERLQRHDYAAAPMMIDTAVYAPGNGDAIRHRWQQTSGGTRFLFAACRHTWQWKGNDRLLRGFAEFATNGGRHWRLVLQTWGEDTERSKALARELGISDLVIWERLCSKPLLRERQKAADAAADQFVMPGAYGTSVLEALAAAKPVIITPPPPSLIAHLPAPPPFVGANDAASIAAALRRLDDDDERSRIGAASVHWLQRVHGPENVGRRYLAGYERALGIPVSED